MQGMIQGTDKEILIEFCEKMSLRRVDAAPGTLWHDQYTVREMGDLTWIALGCGGGCLDYYIEFQFDSDGNILYYEIRGG